MVTTIFVFTATLIASYLYHGLGITLGYHRLLSHRAFKVPRWLEYFVFSGGYLCLEGSPIAWVTGHRLHHRYSDHDGDPHSPRDGFFHAFIGWMLERNSPIAGVDRRKVCPDLYAIPLYKFLDVNATSWHAWLCLFLSVLFRVAILMFLGPVALAANLIATAVVFVAPLLVNTFCHLPAYGYRNFETTDMSRNVPFVAMWALGEGWHNNHHALPQSPRHGMKPGEFDLTWMTLQLLKSLGLASDFRLSRVLESTPDDDQLGASECEPEAEPSMSVVGGSSKKSSAE